MGLQWRQSTWSSLPPGQALDNPNARPTREWFAIQVRAGREAFSAAHLRVRGYEVLLPSYVEHREWSDRIRKVNRALFEGYLFCQTSVDVAGTIVTAPGVIRLVGNSQGPIAIPLDEIDAIQRIVDQQLSATPWPYLEAGQRVRIEIGPLSGTEGFVVTMKNQCRLVVSITLLQRAVAVEMPIEWVRVPLDAKGYR